MENKLILTTEPCCNTVEPCCNPNQDGICDTSVSCSCDEPKQIITNSGAGDGEENNQYAFTKLAAVLQDSVLYSWKMHLKAKKYYVHVILEEYYNEAFDLIDALIEHYQGICKCDIIGDNVGNNIIPDMLKSDDPYTYFISLKDYLMDFVNDSNNFNEKTLEIKSDIDDLLRLIDSTLYKLGNLTESKIKSFEAFIYEK